MADLSICIVNWNTRDPLIQCLTSVVQGTQRVDYEIVIVDNASTDGSVLAVQEGFPQVKLIVNSSNLGFAKAANQAITENNGRYVLLLNPDTRPVNNAIGKMVEFMNRHPDAGAMGPRLVLPDGSPQPYSFGCDPTLGYLLRRGLNLLLRKGYLHDWGAEEIREVDWVSGASLMLRRRALEETGLLDENFFLYFEDNDLCLRLRQKGWRIYFNPQINVLHWGGRSLAQNEKAQKEYFYSLLYFYNKHYGKLRTAILFILLSLYRWLVGLRR